MILQPCYDFPKPNESILISQTKASVFAQGKVHEGDAKVYLDLLPDARIHIRATFPPLFLSPDKLAIAGRDVPGFAIASSISLSKSSDSKTEVIWGLSTEPIIGHGDQNTQMVAVVFHLFNYMDFFGTRASFADDKSSQRLIPHLDIHADGWNIEIKSLPTTSDTFKILREKGGYGLTHIGCLRKEDTSSFDGKTAEEMLTALCFFLSFSKGMWCNPCLAVGFDDKENMAWESWGSPQGGWANPSSWFDPQHCEQLVNFFPGFMARWKNEDWREALHEVIYWYLNSNRSSRGIDAGIILTQAAIERLSFEYTVRHKRLIEADGFKDLRASDKFRLLFSSLDIPIDIPASLSEMQSLAKQFNWIDAPQAITEIRNSLVHPEHKRRGKFGEAFFSAWNLGQWYLELALLRICEYSGTYSNRLVVSKYVGTVESVPWGNSKGKLSTPAHL